MIDQKLLEETEETHRVGFSLGGQRMTYQDVLRNPPPKLRASMEKIIPQIDMDSIWNIIDGTEGLSNSRKRYIFAGVRMRYENIL